MKNSTLMIKFGGVLSSVRCLSREASASRSPRVTIPPAIQRGPTDILEALSDTVGVDTTAPHFAFIDDPAMIPTTAQSKRNYYMAKEMGKRAARQLAEEWPTLFQFDRDQPQLPVFRPQKSDDPLKVEPSESNLNRMIDSREVEDAGLLYERMRADNIDVSPQVQLKLLRLMSYYNGKNLPFAEWEEWHGMRSFGENDALKWTEAGLADLLFETLPKSSETVSILICGLCKFGNYSRARSLYKEHGSTLGLNGSAWDSLIGSAPWNEATPLLKEMSAAGIEPSASTWKAVVTSAAGQKKMADRLSSFESVMGEMAALNVVPSLESLHLILSSILPKPEREEGKVDEQAERAIKLAVTWLTEVMCEMERRPVIEVASARDHLFFSTAMEIASRAANLDVAERVVKLYESPANHVKLPALTAEGRFYSRYLMLFIDSCQSIESIDAKYRSLVPRLVGAGRQLTAAVAAKLKSNSHWPLLLRVVDDAICSRQMIDFRMGITIRERLIDVSYQSLSVAERDEFAGLVRRLVDIWCEFSRFTDDWNRRMQMKLSPSVISECAVLLNRIGDVDRAYELLNLLLTPEAAVGDEATVMNTGFARPSAMMELFEDALRQADSVKAATCLEIMGSTMNRSKLEPLAQRIHDRCHLTEVQSRIINGFVRLRPQ